MLDLPSVRRAWWRGDEEHFLRTGRAEMLVGGWVCGCWFAEVDAHAFAEEGLAVEGLAYGDGGGDVVEGDDYSAEGAEWGKGVEWCGSVDQCANDGEVLGCEDGAVVEVGDEEGVR